MRNERPRHPLVGTALKEILARFFIRSQPGCRCDWFAEVMDREGPEWCEQNCELIIDRMEREAGRRRLPFFRWVGKKLLDLAHRRAQKKFDGEMIRG